MKDDVPSPIVDASCDCGRCTSRTKEMYDLDGRCLNCGQPFTVRSRRGDRAPVSVTCPACGVDGYSWKRAANPIKYEGVRSASPNER